LDSNLWNRQPTYLDVAHVVGGVDGARLDGVDGLAVELLLELEKDKITFFLSFFLVTTSSQQPDAEHEWLGRNTGPRLCVFSFLQNALVYVLT
jgi:hypothetical protein